MPTAAAGPTRLLADTRWWARATGHGGTQSKDRKRENEWKSLIGPSTLSFCYGEGSPLEWLERKPWLHRSICFVITFTGGAPKWPPFALCTLGTTMCCKAHNAYDSLQKKIQEKDAKLNFSCLQSVTWHSNRNYQNPFSVCSSRYRCNNLVLLVLFKQRHWCLCISHVIRRSRSQRSDIRIGCTNASFIFVFFFF